MSKDPIKMLFHCRNRKSPFFHATVKSGMKACGVYNHMYLPSYYTDPEDEYWALMNNVVLWDVSVERVVEITGRDAFAFTNMLTPRDLNKCEIGQCKYVVICDEQGGILNDPVLTRLGKNHFWLAAADSDLLFWVKGLATSLSMNVTVKEPDVSPLQVQGPKSKELMLDLFVGQKEVAEAIDILPYYHFIETELGDIPVVVTRTGYTGELGYEIYLRDGSRGEELWNKILLAGKHYKIQPAGPSNIARIEAGMMSWGFDMTLDNNPFEIFEPEILSRLVDVDQKYGFVGRDALREINARGVTQKLVGIEIPGKKIVSVIDAFEKSAWEILAGGKVIGSLRSMAYSPRMQKTIGYAMVPIKYAELGTKLFITIPCGETYTVKSATVVKKPFKTQRV